MLQAESKYPNIQATFSFNVTSIIDYEVMNEFAKSITSSKRALRLKKKRQQWQYRHALKMGEILMDF